MGRSNFVSEHHDKVYRDTVSKLRQDLGRIVKVYSPGKANKCPNCLWSPVSKQSANVYSPNPNYPTADGIPGPTPFTHGVCPVCQGSGQYSRLTVKNILCHVRWLVPKDKEWTPLGETLNADCRLQADIRYLNDFQRTPIKVLVDNQPMEVKKVYQRGLKKLVQVIVFLKASTDVTPGDLTRVTFGGPL